MPQVVDYCLRGQIVVPDDWTIGEKEFTLPDGRSIKIWEAFELHTDGDPSDSYEDLSFNQMTEFGCYYDGAAADLTHIQAIEG